MTTIIATKDGMYSDSRMTGGHVGRCQKIVKIQSSIYGCSGDVESFLRFIDWRQDSDQEKPEFSEKSTFVCLELNEKGNIFRWSEALVRMPIDAVYWAVGSGSSYALGALSAGATPEAAIKIAGKWDECTGGKIQKILREIK